MRTQTAVEWLEEIYLTTGIDRNVHFNQAKQMEKQQMVDFANDYLDDDADLTAEEYYEEIYGGE
jgi:hypothetical protein